MTYLEWKNKEAYFRIGGWIPMGGSKPLQPLRRSLVALLCLLALNACRKTYAVWLGATGADAVQFHISEDRGEVYPVKLRQFSVFRCGSNSTPIWLIDGDGESAEPANIIVYGVAPDGWRTVVEAQPLSDGCFTAGGSETNTIAFLLVADEVREIPADEVSEYLAGAPSAE